MSQSTDAGEASTVESQSNNEGASTSAYKLTDAQKAQIERNRQRALLIRQARSMTHPYSRNGGSNDICEGSVVRIQGNKVIDTGGGFLIDESDLQEQEARQQGKSVSQPAPIIEPDRPRCIECQLEFPDSFLLNTFDYPVCDKCRDNDGKHCLITKTDAKNEFLLKDHDFDRREPALKFIVRKNPHNPRWGDMKLYLRVQVEKRAMEIWESEEKLEEEKEQREEKRELSKMKKYNKQVKSLRMAMRSSLYTKDISTHEHEYGPETYDESEDMYRKECTTCGHSQTYEKM